MTKIRKSISHKDLEYFHLTDKIRRKSDKNTLWRPEPLLLIVPAR